MLDLRSFVVPKDPHADIDNIFYVRASIRLTNEQVEMWAEDKNAEEILGTRQTLPSASSAAATFPVVFFGPGICALRSSKTVIADSAFVGNINNLDLGWITVATVAPTMESVPVFDAQSYLYDPITYSPLPSISALDALEQRLLADSLARFKLLTPQNPDLKGKVHARQPHSIASEILSYDWVKAIQNNPSDYYQPGHPYSISVDLGNGQSANATVEPLKLMQFVGASGSVEACTLGTGVTFPISNRILPSAVEVARSLFQTTSSDDAAFPLQLVRVTGTFREAPKPGSTQPNDIKVVSYGRPCWPDPPRSTYVATGEKLPPIVRDGEAHVDVEISFSRREGAETIYLERQYPSGSSKAILKDVNGDPMPFRPSDFVSQDRPLRTSHLFDTQVPLPFVSPEADIYFPIARDEFGRWREDSSAKCYIETWPVYAPTLLSSEVNYSQSGDVSLVIVVAWDWTLRSPLRIRFGLAIGVDDNDPLITSLNPSKGLSSPSLGIQSQCNLIFGKDGAPALDFHPTAPSSASPTVQPHSQTDTSATSIDERSYRIEFPLGSANVLFLKRDGAYASVIADAQEVVSGNRWSNVSNRLSMALLDPRPPQMSHIPWTIRWASRANPSKRSSVSLPLPKALGSLKGFMVWRAHESSLLDVLLPGTDAVTQELLHSIQREGDMDIRLDILKGLFEKSDSADTKFRATFISVFESASTEIYKQLDPEFDLSGRQTGLEFFLITAISNNNVTSEKKELAVIYAVATPQAKSRPRPALQVIASSENGLFELSNLCLLIVSSPEPIQPEEVRAFWAKGNIPSSEDELFIPLKSIRLTSQLDAERYITDLDGILRKQPYPYSKLFLCNLPNGWERQYLTVDFCSITRSKPSDDIPSPRAPIVSCFSFPNALPTLKASGNGQNTPVKSTILYENLPLSGGSRGVPSEVLLHVLQEPDKAPVVVTATLSQLIQTPLQVVIHGNIISASRILVKNDVGEHSAIVLASEKPLRAGTVCLAIRDPLGRTASVWLP